MSIQSSSDSVSQSPITTPIRSLSDAESSESTLDLSHYHQDREEKDQGMDSEEELWDMVYLWREHVDLVHTQFMEAIALVDRKQQQIVDLQKELKTLRMELEKRSDLEKKLKVLQIELDDIKMKREKERDENQNQESGTLITRKRSRNDIENDSQDDGPRKKMKY